MNARPADWCAELAAIATRLRLALAVRSDGPIGKPAHSDADEVRAECLGCARALDRLLATMDHAALDDRQLRREVTVAQDELAATRAELLGTQAGELQARHRASHDGLTALPNRFCFHERLDQALLGPDSSQTHCAVFYLDLDDFKPINDRHGHGTGDELLRIVAARLVRTVRAQDFVGRLGGDEFACLFTHVADREQLSHLACKLFDAVSAPITIDHLTLTVRPSIGIAMGPVHGSTTASLLQRADEAMYHAKRTRSGYAFANVPSGSICAASA